MGSEVKHCFGSRNCEGISEQNLLWMYGQNQGRMHVTSLTQTGNICSSRVQRQNSRGHWQLLRVSQLLWDDLLLDAVTPGSSLCVHHFFCFPFLSLCPPNITRLTLSNLKIPIFALRWIPLHRVGPTKHFWLPRMVQTLYRQYAPPFTPYFLCIPPNQNYSKVSEIAQHRDTLSTRSFPARFGRWGWGMCVHRGHTQLLCVACTYIPSEELLLWPAPMMASLNYNFLQQE